jgi:hypothetical protein
MQLTPRFRVIPQMKSSFTRARVNSALRVAIAEVLFGTFSSKEKVHYHRQVFMRRLPNQALKLAEGALVNHNANTQT